MKISKISLGEYRNIGLMCQGIPYYRALPWEVSKNLKALAADIEGEIDVEIGKQLQDLKDRVKARFQEILADIPEGEKTEQEIKNRAAKDDKLNEIYQEEATLWEREIKVNTSEIPFPDANYNDAFSRDLAPVQFMGNTLQVDGYEAFLTLCVKGILKKAES